MTKIQAFPVSRTWNEEVSKLEHTPGHVNCPRCKASTRGLMHGLLDSSLIFNRAAPEWLAERLGIKPSTRHAYQQYIKSLAGFFGELPLRDIEIGHFREYQKWRAEKRTAIIGGRGRDLGAGPKKLNQELHLLSQILKRAGLWAPLADAYEPLRVEATETPRALTLQEEERLFYMAGNHPEWQVAYWCALLAVNTSMSAYETRTHRLRDVDLAARVITIYPESAKVSSRKRAIPLTDQAFWVATQLVERARRLGAWQPFDYLFPFRVARGRYDPTRPASATWISRSWREMRHAAGLDWLRFHDLRVTCITKLLESGAPDAVVMSIAGHVTRQMMLHYGRIHQDPMRQALEAVALRRRSGPQAVENVEKKAAGRPKPLKPQA
jgi:integrase